MERDEIIDCLLGMDLKDYEDLQNKLKKKMQSILDQTIKEYKNVFNEFTKKRSLYFQASNEFLKVLDERDYYKKSIDSRQTDNNTHRYNTRSKKENLKPKKEPLDENYEKIQDKYMVQLCKFDKIEKQYLGVMEILKQEQLDIKESYITFYKKLHGSNVDMEPVEKELESYTINMILCD